MKTNNLKKDFGIVLNEMRKVQKEFMSNTSLNNEDPMIADWKPANPLKDELIKLLYERLEDLFYCDRVWSAWDLGTMSEDDFSLITEDEEFMEELLDDFLNIFEKYKGGN